MSLVARSALRVQDEERSDEGVLAKQSSPARPSRGNDKEHQVSSLDAMAPLKFDTGEEGGLQPPLELPRAVEVEEQGNDLEEGQRPVEVSLKSSEIPQFDLKDHNLLLANES